VSPPSPTASPRWRRFGGGRRTCADAYLVKPFTPRDLFARVNALMRGVVERERVSLLAETSQLAGSSLRTTELLRQVARLVAATVSD
jgi:DNA-binding response OmpR family regulator